MRPAFSHAMLGRECANHKAESDMFETFSDMPTLWAMWLIFHPGLNACVSHFVVSVSWCVTSGERSRAMLTDEYDQERTP